MKMPSKVAVFSVFIASTSFCGITGGHVPFPQIKNWDSLVMTLSRSGCYGACPAYKVEIHGDGSIVYTGTAFVAVKGRRLARVSHEVVQQLFSQFQRADFFSLREKYTSPVTDNPTCVVSISFDGTTKSVVDYVGSEVGMPQSVTDLEQAIDRAAGTKKWIRNTNTPKTSDR